MTETERELVITRVFDAPRELVFRCWTEPDHLAKWYGPTGFTTTSVTVDATEGGAWRTCIRNSADGVEYWASGVYLEVDPPERLVFSFRWDPQGGQPAEDTLVSIAFADRDGKTEMTFRQSGFDTDASRDGHADGWRQTFDDLASHLREQPLPQGDPRLLESDVARELLREVITARLAYVAKDGTPRVLPINFHWTGEEIVMGGFARSGKNRALRANPAVAITIDVPAPPRALLIRGAAEITEIDGVVPEYETVMRRIMPTEQADAYFAELRRQGVRMERIAVRPVWVGVVDFQTRFPAAMPEFLRS